MVLDRRHGDRIAACASPHALPNARKIRPGWTTGTMEPSQCPFLSVLGQRKRWFHPMKVGHNLPQHRSGSIMERWKIRATDGKRVAQGIVVCW